MNSLTLKRQFQAKYVLYSQFQAKYILYSPQKNILGQTYFDLLFGEGLRKLFLCPF